MLLDLVAVAVEPAAEHELLFDLAECTPLNRVLRSGLLLAAVLKRVLRSGLINWLSFGTLSVHADVPAVAADVGETPNGAVGVLPHAAVERRYIAQKNKL